ncbi:hypothetical protein ATANTOWER_011729 [Ataeniobius toweri]|uniref:Uncharacterized protein n=1 Tax=Ataeniobius toweri TaxID=208326 RepID=A0ABU7BTL1_9TELE|nr:hypothetical protein [Ataeniobius toweri]
METHRTNNVCTHTRAHTHTPKVHLERPINLTVMFSDCGKKPEDLVRTYACTGEQANSMQKDPRPGFEPGTFLLQGNRATPSYKKIHDGSNISFNSRTRAGRWQWGSTDHHKHNLFLSPVKTNSLSIQKTVSTSLY